MSTEVTATKTTAAGGRGARQHAAAAERAGNGADFPRRVCRGGGSMRSR